MYYEWHILRIKNWLLKVVPSSWNGYDYELSDRAFPLPLTSSDGRPITPRHLNWPHFPAEEKSRVPRKCFQAVFASLFLNFMCYCCCCEVPPVWVQLVLRKFFSFCSALVLSGMRSSKTHGVRLGQTVTRHDRNDHTKTFACSWSTQFASILADLYKISCDWFGKKRKSEAVCSRMVVKWQRKLK